MMCCVCDDNNYSQYSHLPAVFAYVRVYFLTRRRFYLRRRATFVKWVLFRSVCAKYLGFFCFRYLAHHHHHRRV